MLPAGFGDVIKIEGVAWFGMRACPFLVHQAPDSNQIPPNMTDKTSGKHSLDVDGFANMEGVGLMSYIATSHQGAFNTAHSLDQNFIPRLRQQHSCAAYFGFMFVQQVAV